MGEVLHLPLRYESVNRSARHARARATRRRLAGLIVSELSGDLMSHGYFAADVRRMRIKLFAPNKITLTRSTA